MILRLVLHNRGIKFLDIAFCLQHLGPGDIDLGQFRLDLLLQGQVVIPGIVKLRPGLCQVGLEGAGVYFKEQVIGLHELVIFHGQSDDRTGHARRDLDDVGAHLPVAGPGINDIVPVLEQHRDDGDQDNGPGEQIFS